MSQTKDEKIQALEFFIAGQKIEIEGLQKAKQNLHNLIEKKDEEIGLLFNQRKHFEDEAYRLMMKYEPPILPEIKTA